MRSPRVKITGKIVQYLVDGVISLGGITMARRRHYRVAQREAQHKPARGIFISNKKKSKVAVIASVILAAAFIKGILIGCLITKWNSR